MCVWVCCSGKVEIQCRAFAYREVNEFFSISGKSLYIEIMMFLKQYQENLNALEYVHTYFITMHVNLYDAFLVMGSLKACIGIKITLSPYQKLSLTLFFIFVFFRAPFKCF